MRPAERSVPAINSVKQIPSAIINLVEDCVKISSATRICINLGCKMQITITKTNIANKIALLVKNVLKFFDEKTTSPPKCFLDDINPFRPSTSPIIIKNIGRS